MRDTVRLIILTTALLGLLALSGCDEDETSNQSQSDFAAKVGTQSISDGAVRREIRLGNKLKAQQPGLSLTFSPPSVLRFMILNEWNRQEAVSRGVRIPPGVSYTEERTLAYDGLVRAVLARKRFDATELEVRRYFSEHRSEFERPATRLIRIVAAGNRQMGSAAARALRAGNLSVPAIRARYSRGAAEITQDSAGLAVVQRGKNELPAELEKAIFEAPPKQIVGPVRAGSTWYVFEVTTAAPAAPPSLEQNRSEITEQVRQAKSTDYMERFIKDLEKKYRPRTACTPALVVPECSTGA